MLQLNAGIRQFGIDVVVRHPVELLAERAGGFKNSDEREAFSA
jgi:hypothetical protein